MRLTLLRLYRRYRENLIFGGYIVLIGLLAPQVARLLNTGWEASQLVRSVIGLVQLAGFAPSLIVLLGFGLVAGLILLMTIDSKKRWQAVVLWFGFALVVYQLVQGGQLLSPTIISSNAAWAVPGAVVGVVVGGGISLVQLQSLGPQEFRRAPALLYLTVAGVLLVALIETHLVYPTIIETTATEAQIFFPETSSVGLQTTNLGANFTVAVVAVITLKRFTQYDADTEFFVIGPPASGKSLLLIGAYLEALNEGRDQLRRSEALDPSQDLMELVENLDQDNSEWIVEATGRGELRNLEFKYIKGSLIPRKVTISALDYAGEHLSRLPAVLSGEADAPSEEITQIAQGVSEATTLIMLIDSERFLNNEGLGLAEYFEILKSAEDNNVILVATKTDIFADMFWEEYELSPQEDFDAFRDFVEDQLTQSEQFASLLRQTPTSEVHPVYYETEFNESGERVPYRDEDGSAVTVGFKELLEKLGR